MSVMELKLNKYLVLRINLLDSSLNSRLDKNFSSFTAEKLSFIVLSTDSSITTFWVFLQFIFTLRLQSKEVHG